MAVVGMGQRWLARMRREGVRRAGFSCKVGELPYGLGLGKPSGWLLWKATCGCMMYSGGGGVAVSEEAAPAGPRST